MSIKSCKHSISCFISTCVLTTVVSFIFGCICIFVSDLDIFSAELKELLNEKLKELSELFRLFIEVEYC